MGIDPALASTLSVIAAAAAAGVLLLLREIPGAAPGSRWKLAAAALVLALACGVCWMLLSSSLVVPIADTGAERPLANPFPPPPPL